MFHDLPPLSIPKIPKMYMNSQISNWKIKRFAAKQFNVLIKVVLGIPQTKQFTLMKIDF